MLEKIKEFVDEHKKGVKIAIIFVCIFVFISIAIYNLRQVDFRTEEEKEEHYTVYLTSKQEELINSYDSKTENLMLLLTNSKWTDSRQEKALFIKDNEIIERYKGEEFKTSFAICAFDKSSDKVDGKIQVTYNITILDNNNSYNTMEFVKVSSSEGETAPIYTATLTSEDIFRNAKTYIRCSNSDEFAINEWQNNANQFIDDNYDGMYSALKNYCALNLPSISNIYWSGTVTISYTSNKIFLTFNTGTTNNLNLNVTYSKDTKNFLVERK